MYVFLSLSNEWHMAASNKRPGMVTQARLGKVVFFIKCSQVCQGIQKVGERKSYILLFELSEGFLSLNRLITRHDITKYIVFYTAAVNYNITAEDLQDYLQMLLGQMIFDNKNISMLLTTAQCVENALSAHLEHEVTADDILMLLDSVSYQIEDMFLRCRYVGVPAISDCTSSEFFTPIFTMMGKCYIFNFRQKVGVLQQPSICAYYGLHIFLDIHQEHYSGNIKNLIFFFLPN